MVRPNASPTFDYEGELAVIIGRRCRHVKKADWESVVAGYSCYNDGSIREWQRHSTQFTPGKNFYRSGAFGPWIVTPEEAGEITKAHLMSRLNGKEQQHATIDDLCFDIPTLIEYCSTFTQLEAGDVIATGTTGGVGAYQTPPLWMRARRHHRGGNHGGRRPAQPDHRRGLKPRRKTFSNAGAGAWEPTFARERMPTLRPLTCSESRARQARWSSWSGDYLDDRASCRQRLEPIPR